MRLHIVQKNVLSTDLVPYVRQAAEAGCDLVCFGELATTGCLYQMKEVEPLKRMVDRLSPYRVAVMFGAARKEAACVRNSYVCLSDGRTQVYDKVNLFPPFNEDKVYEAGDRPGYFSTPFGEFGVAICYDLRFDEIFDKLAKRGAPYLIVPAAFPRVRIDDWRRLLKQRARETGATVIGVNAVGRDGVNQFGGSSMVVAPAGKVLAQADETTEQVIDIEI